MKKLFTKSISVFLVMLLVMTSFGFSAFALDTDEEKEMAAEYDALEYEEDIALSYKVSGYEIQAQSGQFSPTRMNIGNLVIHKVPLPKIPSGKQIDKFIFRTGTGTNSTEILRIDYTEWDFSNLPLNLGAESEQLKPITTKATYSNYSIAEGEAIKLSGGVGNYQRMYSDISSYAKECIAKGQEYFYMAVGCFASTQSVALGSMTDSDYLKANLDPRVLYSFKEAPVLESVSSSVEDGAEDVAADGEVSFEFSNDIASAEVTVNGETVQCSVDGTTVRLEDDLEECADFEVEVSVRDIYGQSKDASVRFATGLKYGAVVPVNPSIGTYNVKCVLSKDCSELSELSFKLLTEFDDINKAIEIREIGGDTLDAGFAFNEDTLRYDITSPAALDAGTAYEAVIKAGAEDKYGEAAQSDVVITRFFAGETRTDEFAENSDCDFTVEIDKENSTLDIWFKYPVYSNREMELALLVGDEVIVSETVMTGARGIATLRDVALSESGEYTVRVCPGNSPECFGMVYSFYTPEDILGFWNMIAQDGKAEDILNHRETLCSLFDIDNEYMSEISDFGAWAEKTAALRGEGFGDMTDGSEAALRDFIREVSLFTAFEQCKDPEIIKSYVDGSFEKLQSANAEVCSRWTERMASDYAGKIVEELTSADKTINAYTDITDAMNIPLTKYSVENIKAQEYEALGDIVDIPDSYKVYDGKIHDDSGQFTSTKINSGTMLIYKIALPSLPAGKTIDKFILRTGSAKLDLTVLKMTHAMPALGGLPMDVPESFAPIMAADTYKDYNAADGKNIVVTGGHNYMLNYIDISAYAKECVADGCKDMYIGIGCYSSSCNVAQGGMTDTDYLREGLDPKYIASFGDPDANAFVSSSVANNAEDVAADAEVAFKFVNCTGSATALLNGKEAEVSANGRTVTLKTPLSECSDYELTISATDIFGQKATKTIRFSTGFKSGKTEAETPVIGVYDAKYSVNTASNELMELSFALLTKFADVNQAIEIREIGGSKIESEFVYYDTYSKYEIASPVALTAGKGYEAVIRKGASDIYGNTAAADVVIAKFYAGETPDTEITGGGAELEASLDAQNATLSIYFKNPIYSNNDVTVTIKDEDDTVYTKTVSTGKRGVIAIDGISLPESGNYTLSIAPVSAPGVYRKTISFYTESDILKYWKMAAVNGKAGDITANFDKLEYIFSLSNEYSDKISDVSGLSSKIAAQRSGFNEMTADAIEAFRNLCYRLSYFTAVEQSKTFDEINALINSEFATLSAENEAVCDEWTKALASEFSKDVKDAFDGMEKSADSYADVVGIMDKAIDAYRVKNLLKLIGEAVQRTEISAVVSVPKNAELLGIAEFLDRYNDLGTTLEVDKALMKKFDSPKDFAKAFEEVLEAAEEARDDKEHDRDSSSGSFGGSGSGSGGGFHVASTVPTPQTAFNPFADIENISWAKDHIIKLYNRGIINGKSAVSFAPYDNITREEITKLISSMMKLADNGSAADFTDVDDSSWYAAYVRAAVSNGICQGIGGGAFGVGMNATRQDIAVMIVNALKTKGIQITDETADFADSFEIADYAMSAVAFLNAKGVLSGDDAKCFNPKSNATRAEVAVMLSRAADIFSIN